MKQKFAIVIINIREEIPNLHIATDHNGHLAIVETEAEAEKLVQLEYPTPKYQFYGLIPDPTKIYKSFKRKVAL